MSQEGKEYPPEICSGWLTEYRCVECEAPMSDHVMMYSSGRCPHCGFKHPSACTIVECSEHAYRLAYIEPKRLFKKRKTIRIYG